MIKEQSLKINVCKRKSTNKYFAIIRTKDGKKRYETHFKDRKFDLSGLDFGFKQIDLINEILESAIKNLNIKD